MEQKNKEKILVSSSKALTIGLVPYKPFTVRKRYFWITHDSVSFRVFSKGGQNDDNKNEGGHSASMFIQVHTYIVWNHL